MERILIVDDEESIRVSLAALIRRHGYRVETARDGMEGLEIIREGRVDAAFVDVKMPVMDGITLTRTVADEGLSTTLIVMSAYGSIDDAREAMQAGAYDYVTKPFKPDEVTLVLAKAAEREERNSTRVVHSPAEDQALTGNIIHRSSVMKEVLVLVKKIARVDSTALIIGESGTGKELVAKALHENSARHNNTFVGVNCGAFPENLIESELFGHRKGAFTDAVSDKPGLFTQADGGTLLLDEIGELPLSLQVKLLRVLQEGSFRPLGSDRDVRVDVRVVAATFRDLEQNVKNGTFREDLFYRLNVLPINIPPLRDRKDDVTLLVEHFIAANNKRFNTGTEGLSKEASEILLNYQWPGNVRELQNIIERAQVLSEGKYITADDLPDKLKEGARIIPRIIESDDLSIKKATRFIEEELIRKALVKTGGNRTAACKLLEISHRALLYKIKEYKIS